MKSARVTLLLAVVLYTTLGIVGIFSGTAKAQSDSEASLIPATNATGKPLKKRYLVYPRRDIFGTAFSASIFNQSRAKTVHMLRNIAARAIDVDNVTDLDVLKSNPNIVRIEEDVRRHPLTLGADDGEPAPSMEERVRRVLQQVSEQIPYGVGMTAADSVTLAPGTTRSNLAVCIIDSGVNATHEDLASASLAGYSTNWNTDTCGHGTHVTGILAAVKGNSKGVAGGANGVAVYTVKVFDGSNCGWMWSSDLIAATQKCVDAAAGAKLIINLSLGGTSSSLSELNGFQALWDNGVLSIAAAGNRGTTDFVYPASYPSVLSVAAIDSSRNVGSFSQKNNQVNISAPGVSVLSTYNGGYAYLDGTSMATPYVSAAAAITWSYGLKNNWTNVQVRNALVNTATDLGVVGRDDSYGVGLVNACKAAKRAGYTSSSLCLDESSTCGANIANIDFYGGDLATIYGAPTAADCCQYCTGECQVFTWTPWSGGVCYLKSTLKTGFSVTTSTAGLVSGIVGRQLLQNVDFTGNDLYGVQRTFPSDCWAVCASVSTCKSFAWNSYNGGTCWLKSAVPTSVTFTSGVASGVL